jgi:hypothetical protein
MRCTGGMGLYQWNFSEINAHLDRPAERLSEDQIMKTFSASGMAPSLMEFLVPLYAEANGATFLDGAFRVLPLWGLREHGFPSLLEWNDPRGWKQFEEPKANDTFYFCANAFGDLFGLPITPQMEMAKDRIGMLWTERYEYQEAGIEWNRMILRLLTERDFANYFARMEQYNWLVKTVGRPDPWQCFSSNVPQILGGQNSIDNIAIQSLRVHVSFTLQLLKQWKEKGLVPGTSVSMVDLYDKEGNLMR